MPDFFEVFPILIQKIKFSFTQQESSEIVHSIDQEKLEMNGLIKNGYRSKTNTFLDRKQWLKDIFQKEINTYIDKSGIIPAKISYSWCNIYTDLGLILPHKHEMSLISGVFYPLLRGSNSFFKIRNPCTPFKINEISKKTTKFTLQESTIPIEENLLILFPSWVEHYSDNGADLKYVLSFDTEIDRCRG